MLPSMHLVHNARNKLRLSSIVVGLNVNIDIGANNELMSGKSIVIYVS